KPSVFDPFPAQQPAYLPHPRPERRRRPARRARTRSSVRRNPQSGSSLTAATVETSIQTMFSASVLTEASAGSDDGNAAVRASTRSRDDDPPVGQTLSDRPISRPSTVDFAPLVGRSSFLPGVARGRRRSHHRTGEGTGRTPGETAGNTT